MISYFGHFVDGLQDNLANKFLRVSKILTNCYYIDTFV